MYFDQPEKLIAHRGKMRFIDRVLDATDKGLCAESIVDSEHIFFDPVFNGLPAWVGVELMAQAVAAWVGLEDLNNHREITLGFLLGSRDFVAEQAFFPAGKLQIDVRVILAADNTMVFSGEITNQSGEQLARGDITCYRPEDLSAYLKGNVEW